MPSIFTKIINGEIPSWKIAESSQFYAFLDINPLAKGHTLVVPKLEIDYIFDLPDDTLSEMMVFSKKVGKAIESTVKCERIGVSVLGLEVPHAHIHLIPINNIGDINFSKARLDMSDSEIQNVANSIARAFSSLYPDCH